MVVMPRRETLPDHERTFNEGLSSCTATGTGCPTGTGTGNASFSTVLKSGGTGTPGYLVTPPVFGIH